MASEIMTMEIHPETRGPRSRRLAGLAVQALIAEAELSPKPGLVDQRGSGAHADLSLELMRASARSLEPFFASMAEAARQIPLGHLLREQLGLIGRRAEQAMYATSGGTNTHKGAIWALGLLVAAASHAEAAEPLAITKVAGSIARLPDPGHREVDSHGNIVGRRYGVTGARGEAFADFPHVTGIGLPALRAARTKGRTESASRLCALLAIMASLDDTCVLYRAGRCGAALVMAGAQRVLAEGGPESSTGESALEAYDRDLVARRISPGGSADLLAATIFLDHLQLRNHAAQQNQKGGEDLYGRDEVRLPECESPHYEEISRRGCRLRRHGSAGRAVQGRRCARVRDY